MNTIRRDACWASPRKPWWFEPEILVLILVVGVAHLARIGDVSMRGEEPRRAQVAFEMLDSGNWLLPLEQGEPFLSRPPLHNWLIAISSVVCGSRAPWAVRLPSVLALLFTTLLIYGYTRCCLSRTGALGSALAFLTLGEMFTTGSQAETEMVFISLTSAALLLWHWGEMARWPALRTWMASYLCVGLAVLTKGLQPPAYFLGSVGAYLILTGQWRRLFSRAHAVGMLVGAAVVAGWLIPFVLREGPARTHAIFFSDTAVRMTAWKPLQFARHLVEYPLEILGCTLPWSLLLVCYASPNFRRTLGKTHPLALFAGLCVGICFPTCWLPPGGETRYFAPLYPCLAVLIGVVIERCSLASVPFQARAVWDWYVRCLAWVILAAGATVLGGTLVLAGRPRFQVWAEQPSFALAYAGAAVLLTLLTLRGREAGQATRVRTAVLAVACFMVLTFTGILTNLRIRRSEDQATPMARLKRDWPRGRLISFGHVDALFAYYYGAPISPVPLPKDPDALADREGVLFCFDSFAGNLPPLPFVWEEVAVIPMDRNHRAAVERTVVVGRRLRSLFSPTDPLGPQTRAEGSASQFPRQ